MLDSPIFPVAAGLGLLLGGYCFLRSLRWEAGLKLLVAILCFGGIVSMNLGSGSYAIIFRDLFVVLPLYIGFVTSADGQQALRYPPFDIFAVLMLLLTVMFICVLAAPFANIATLLIGLKVWLFYIPFLAIGMALAARPELLVRFFRTILLWGFAAAAIGLVQSLLVRLVGYEQVMEWFFGANAIKVTQDFTVFDVAGGIYRIPGTFSFVSQYANFLYLYLIVAIAETHIDPDTRYRQIAQIGVILAVVAGLLSGARQTIISFPATLMIFALGGLLSRRMLMIAPFGVALGVAIIALSGLNLVEYFFVGRDLAGEYTENFIGRQVSSGLDFGVLGAGIGSSTTAARYALGLTADATDALGIESYFGKAGAELGWFGFDAIALLMAIVMVRVVIAVLQNLTRRSHAVVAPVAVFLAYIVVSSFKGSPLDTDPGNIFFWLFLGVLVGVSRFGFALDPLMRPDDDLIYSEEDAVGEEGAVSASWDAPGE
jgi:hypothetical protein